jgi:hypothetical protein
MQKITRRAEQSGAGSRDAQLDRYLLELILIDSLAALDPRRGGMAERVVERYIPRPLYERVLERYDCLACDGDEPDVLAHWLHRAARQDTRWKSKMILRFMHIVCVEGRLTEAGMADVAELARAMAAERECRRLFSLACAGQLPAAASQGGLSRAMVS